MNRDDYIAAVIWIGLTLVNLALLGVLPWWWPK